MSRGKAFTPPVLMTGGDEVVTDGTKLDGAVTAQVVEHLRGEKIKVFTFKPKRGFKKTRGHRSELSRIQIDVDRAVEAQAGAGARRPPTRSRREGRGGAGQEAGRQEAPKSRRCQEACGPQGPAGGRGQAEAGAEASRHEAQGGHRRWRIRRASAPRRTAATRPHSGSA